MNQPSVCIIGAGCSGITAVKNLIEAGFTKVTCFEQNSDVGGNWIYSPKVSHSSVSETTHIISSKKMSEFRDFPMPDSYPDYPSHEQVLAYFRSYARHFDVYSFIQFNIKVEHVEKTEQDKWMVTLGDGTSRIFDYILISNGHHSVPRHPELPGKFDGEYLHSHSFKTNKPFKDKRVLVIGAGNSGCDCAVESSRVAQYVALSMRSPQYIVPKFFNGKPVDTYNSQMSWLPDLVKRILLKGTLKLQVGSYSDYNLPEPDFPVTKSHPTLNSELLYKIRHGKVHPKSAIKEINGKTVTFSDGQSEDFDVIIAATGYKIALPFFDSDFINYEEAERIPLYLRMFHPEHPTLVFIGLVQPQGAIWPLSDYQSLLAAGYMSGRWSLPKNVAQLAENEADVIAKEFLPHKRHSVEVHYHSYLRSLKKHIRSFYRE